MAKRCPLLPVSRCSSPLSVGKEKQRPADFSLLLHTQAQLFCDMWHMSSLAESFHVAFHRRTFKCRCWALNLRFLVLVLHDRSGPYSPPAPSIIPQWQKRP